MSEFRRRERRKNDILTVSLEHSNRSVDPEYQDDPSNPVPDDLEITSLCDMKHAALGDNNFGNHFLIVDAVVGFKGVGINPVEAWKQGVTLKKYKSTE